jgi:FolB domain-containing protein
MNRIHIRDLELDCIIGVFPKERTAKQRVVINISMDVDFGVSAESDLLEDTVDYKSLNREIIRFVEASSFNLLEAMAERVASLCLSRSAVHEVTVTIDKPGALRSTRSVAVEVTRRRG